MRANDPSNYRSKIQLFKDHYNSLGWFLMSKSVFTTRTPHQFHHPHFQKITSESVPAGARSSNVSPGRRNLVYPEEGLRQDTVGQARPRGFAGNLERSFRSSSFRNRRGKERFPPPSTRKQQEKLCKQCLPADSDLFLHRKNRNKLSEGVRAFLITNLTLVACGHDQSQCLSPQYKMSAPLWERLLWGAVAYNFKEEELRVREELWSGIIHTCLYGGLPDEQ